MIKSIYIIALLFLQPTSDFSITLSYHPQPFYHQEWFITLARSQSKAYIATNNPQFLRKKRTIAINEYAAIVKQLNSLGIWHCRDSYMQGNYYMLTITNGSYRQQCKIEYSPSIPGNNNYSQIIRTILNTANNYLNN
ncbi:MAG: hypothetical protein KBG92_10375 [Spirochaetes bacterium]|nr:hypothetical protein [Spirochaetota bacterium]HQL43874.1 hypothetical protein [Spirochaetota bacterium]